MDRTRPHLRIAATALLLAISLRVLGGGIFQPLAAIWQNPGLLSFLIYLQTGRSVRLPPSEDTPATKPPAPATSLPPIPATQPSSVPVFSPEALVEVHYFCDYRPDLTSLLLQPLSWDLTADKPTVLIVHTHTTEGYTQVPGQTYSETAPYRTLDERYNMLSIGDEVARILEEGGIQVIHDRTVHDYPSYNDSYSNARQTIQKQLRENPQICLVLDIHRDATDDNSSQLVTVGTVGGQRSAQLMLVAGTDTSGNAHPNWQQNLALALKLSAVLEQTDPGLVRPVSLREHRFNMDLTPGSLIVEVGGAGNTHAEALLAAGALARAVLALAHGSG